MRLTDNLVAVVLRLSIAEDQTPLKDVHFYPWYLKRYSKKNTHGTESNVNTFYVVEEFVFDSAYTEPVRDHRWMSVYWFVIGCVADDGS